MNKENNRGAAGLRRSAIAERIRLREEWSALKEVPDTGTNSRQPDGVLQKKPRNKNTPGVSGQRKQPTKSASQKKEKENLKTSQAACDSLREVVAMVDVGSETRALPLRCTLAALGATVVIDWSPLVTHLVWTDSGNRATRAKARALACKLVSPLWVEACAAANTKLNERTFPAATRHSDLPSPRTLRQLLKRAEMENVPLVDLLSDSKEDDSDGAPKLRISTETDNTTDTSRDTVGYKLYPTGRKNNILLYKGYSFNPLNSKYTWSCSQRRNGCTAKLKLDKKGRLTVIDDDHGGHRRPRYRIDEDGKYVFTGYWMWSSDKGYFFTTDQGKTLLMYKGYTFSFVRANGRILKCSKRFRGKCDAQINLDKNGKVQVIKADHNHPAPVYKKMQNGTYTKLY